MHPTPVSPARSSWPAPRLAVHTAADHVVPPAAAEPLTDAVTVLRGRAAPLAALEPHEAAALGALYRAHAARLIVVARRIVGDSADAEDVVHDVFARLPTVLHLHRGESLWGWLRQVIVREALMRLRRTTRRGEEALPDDGGAIADDDATPVRSPECEELRWAIAQLPLPLREVLVLRVFLELTHQEIAATLDCSVTASEVRLCRAVKQLRILLTPGSATRNAAHAATPGADADAERIGLRRAS